jgi:hypothetical protein
MATIAARKRKDGTTGYTAQVLIKQNARGEGLGRLERNRDAQARRA